LDSINGVQDTVVVQNQNWFFSYNW
jgi:hypothetical protein